MPSMSSVGQDRQKKLLLAIERQLNEQLFKTGAITKGMYEAAKASFEQAAQGGVEP